MALQFSHEVNDAGLAAKIKAVGTSARLRIFSGSCPKRCAEPDPQGLLCEIRLPDPWMTAPKDGVARQVGKWSGEVKGKGKATCFRIYGASGRCAIQGHVGENLRLERTDLSTGQVLIVENMVWPSGNR